MVVSIPMGKLTYVLATHLHRNPLRLNFKRGSSVAIAALSVNMTGFQNVLELAKVHRLRLYSPSTIGAFGPTTPKVNTPDLTIMRPNTIYGITKLHMELLGEVR